MRLKDECQVILHLQWSPLLCVTPEFPALNLNVHVVGWTIYYMQYNKSPKSLLFINSHCATSRMNWGHFMFAVRLVFKYFSEEKNVMGNAYKPSLRSTSEQLLHLWLFNLVIFLFVKKEVVFILNNSCLFLIKGLNQSVRLYYLICFSVFKTPVSYSWLCFLVISLALWIRLSNKYKFIFYFFICVCIVVLMTHDSKANIQFSKAITYSSRPINVVFINIHQDKMVWEEPIYWVWQKEMEDIDIRKAERSRGRMDMTSESRRETIRAKDCN